MFEKVLLPSQQQGRALDHQMMIGRTAGATRLAGGDALRALDWNELTARLNAARDVRSVLRRDTGLHIEGCAASFGDAAARYFAELEQSEPHVNPDALEARKASQVSIIEPQDGAAIGGVRDD